MNILPPQLEAIRVKLNDRRKSIEQVRSFNVRRINADVKKITTQEIDFTKKLFEQMIPVKIIWKKNITKNIQDMIPFTVEINKEQTNDETNIELEDTAPVKNSNDTS
jgi:hypothetical protein